MRIKQGFPADGEIVLCKVTSVQHHSVFCNLEEYNKGGMLHISEVSPGRVRNIREYVKEGKVIICKVLRITEERGHIDLSLRRVSEGQRREKANQLKQEEKAEKIVEDAAEKLKVKPEELLEQTYAAVSKDSDRLYPVFEAVVEQNHPLSEYNLPKETLKTLEEAIRERIKPKEVTIKGDLKLMTYAENGITTIKDALALAEKAGGENIDIKYRGAGTWGVSILAKEFKEAEKILKDATESAIKYLQKNGGTGSFTRIEA
jgi:translation initiation factor 2 subunit 1